MNNNTTATKPSLIYIEKVENLHIDNIELATANIYIEKVENLHITNSQLVLGCYYILLSLGLRPRDTLSIADAARFMHFVTAKTYTNLNNSDFYKKLKHAPNFKADRELIKDLEVIRSLFLQLGLKPASLLIDQELTSAREEINNSSK